MKKRRWAKEMRNNDWRSKNYKTIGNINESVEGRGEIKKKKISKKEEGGRRKEDVI